jgi:hypothetical protein
MKLLLLLMVFQAQPDLPKQNQRQIERMEDRIYAMERQLDRVENTVDEVKNLISNISSTDILLYVVMAIFGIDKGSYWIRRRNGRLNNSGKAGYSLKSRGR